MSNQWPFQWNEMLKKLKTHPNYGTVSNFQVFFFHIANLVGKKEKS